MLLSVFFFFLSPSLRDMTKVDNHLTILKEQSALVLMTSCRTSVVCVHLLGWNLHFSLKGNLGAQL